MPRRPGSSRNDATPVEGLPRRRRRNTGLQPAPAIGGERATQLVALCDHCASAQRIADAQGEKLLAYLLAMAIQEGQTALRRLTATQASILPPE